MLLNSLRLFGKDFHLKLCSTCAFVVKLWKISQENHSPLSRHINPDLSRDDFSTRTILRLSTTNIDQTGHINNRATQVRRPNV